MKRTSLLLLLALAACRQKTESIFPEEHPVTESVYASGIVKARGQYDVYVSVTGILRSVLVREGDLVQAGQPLLLLAQESQRLQAEREELNAQYSTVGANADRLAELGTAIRQARSRLVHDSTQAARSRQLWAEGIGTRAELDQRELALRTAEEAYRAALLRYEQTARQLRQSQQVSRTTAALSRTQLGDFTLRSQVAGRVYSIHRKEGELVSPQTPVAVIGAGDDFVLELQIDEYDIARVQPGQKVLVQMDSYKGQVFEAVVEQIDPIMHERTRSFEVKARLHTRPEKLYPNLTAEANIVLQTKQKALTIPRSYLVSDSFVLLKGKEKRRVQTGLRDYQRVEILSGLRKDEEIIKP